MDVKTDKTIAEYFNENKKLEVQDNRPGKKIKIAILSNFTTKGIPEILNVKCNEQGIFSKIYNADYDQYSQEILNQNSKLYQFNPDLTILIIDLQKILGENFFFPYRLKKEERQKLINEKFREIANLINILSEKLNGKIVINNFLVPTYSPFGILENKTDYGFFEMIKSLNEKLGKKYLQNPKVWVFDFDSFASKHGKINIINSKMSYLAEIRIDMNLISKLCDEYIGYIKPFLSIIKKCLVLDLDNTLWGGIIGEDGVGGIKLGPDTPEGRAFVEFQKHILSLYEKGLILAINSKNNPGDALKVLKEHPNQILKQEHFASIKINWNDKISNMKEIADEINIGLDTFVFFDDDPVNREMVRKSLPEIFVPELPPDPSSYIFALQRLNEFNTLTITEEDKKKGELFTSQRKRKLFLESSSDLSQFLKDLDMSVEISKANQFTIPRIFQLIHKTNQFNMTTKRYSEEETKKFCNDKDHIVFCARVKDKFGDNGITCLVIIQKNQKNWKIDTFLLSCRIIGREIEKAILSFLIEQAKKEGIENIIGEFIPSDRNVPAKDFYKDNNFILESTNQGNQIWSLNIENINYKCPEFIKLNFIEN